MEGVDKDCLVYAFDIFDGNKPNINYINNNFSKYKNLKIEHRDFWNDFNIKNVDIFHVDIANDGNVYKHSLENLFNGIIIFEGGSLERDQVPWMKKYNKVPIKTYLDSISDKYRINDYWHHTISDYNKEKLEFIRFLYKDK